MPTYNYHCEENDKVVEIDHDVNELITTWGGLCTQANIAPGNTPTDAPITKLATGTTEPASKPGGCCSGGNCA